MTTSVPTTIPVPENVILDLWLYGSAMVITGLDGQEHIPWSDWHARTDKPPMPLPACCCKDSPGN
jgi:hypothetical protein